MFLGEKSFSVYIASNGADDIILMMLETRNLYPLALAALLIHIKRDS